MIYSALTSEADNSIPSIPPGYRQSLTSVEIALILEAPENIPEYRPHIWHERATLIPMQAAHQVTQNASQPIALDSVVGKHFKDPS